jgi:hypothetical protein
VRVVITYYNTRISPGGSDTAAETYSKAPILRPPLGPPPRLAQVP